jgi:hypothetical protein
MTSWLLLLGFVLVASTTGARALQAADWPSRAPRIAILAWQSLSASVVLAVTLGSLILILAHPHFSGGVTSFAHLRAQALEGIQGPPARVAASLVGWMLLAGAAGRLAMCAVAVARNQRRERHRLASLVDMVAVEVDPSSVTRVIDHDLPYAFCVPGAKPRVVITSALVARFNSRQLSAVLEHEHAHLRQRHHLAVQLSQTFVSAFGRVAPFLRTAHAQTRRLVELRADDSARRHAGDISLAHALTALSEVPIRNCALAASAVGVEERVHRLVRSPSPLRPVVTLGWSLAVFSLAVAPFALAVLPALAMGGWQDLFLVEMEQPTRR